MPHIIVETNEPHGLSQDVLVEALHTEAMHIPEFPTGGVRVRSLAVEFALIADGATENGYAYVRVRMGRGRSEATRKAIGERLHSILEAWAKEPLSRDLPISLGTEVSETSNLTFKTNTMH